MYLKRFSLVVAIACALFMAPQNAKAEILADDDFESTGSGTGWEDSSDWDGIVSGGISTWGNGNRNFATPLDAEAHDKIYMAFDYTDTVGGGNGWGGVALFEGLDASGDETLFVGDPGNINNYGLDLKEGSTVDSGIVIDTAMHRLIVEADINPGADNDTVRFWLDSNEISAPTAVSPVYNSPYDAAWQSLRLRGDGSVQLDNLVIATTAAEVGLVPEPTSVVLLLSFIAAATSVRQRRVS